MPFHGSEGQIYFVCCGLHSNHIFCAILLLSIHMSSVFIFSNLSFKTKQKVLPICNSNTLPNNPLIHANNIRKHTNTKQTQPTTKAAAALSGHLLTTLFSVSPVFSTEGLSSLLPCFESLCYVLKRYNLSSTFRFFL
jgi:hypothetical protein